jgi:hypothetical protein
MASDHDSGGKSFVAIDIGKTFNATLVELAAGTRQRFADGEQRRRLRPVGDLP